MTKKIIVGLGNPGKEYSKTRHNLGFLMIDEITKDLNLKFNKNFKMGTYCEYDDLFFLKSKNFMNDSGTTIKNFIRNFGIKIENVLVLYDDINLYKGKIRYREKGSHGGHNGFKDIIEKLNTEKIKRLKLGMKNLEGEKVIIKE
jgi:PTH1 family peptidyl-tRNA hydrolase